MAKPYKIPDFRKLYPEASEEVIAVLIVHHIVRNIPIAKMRFF